MLNIRIFKCNPLEENCYLIWGKNGSNECWIVDCGALEASEVAKICGFMDAEGLKPTRHLLTHGHFDHIFGAQALFERYGLRPCMLKEEISNYEKANDLMHALIPQWPAIQLPIAGELLKDGQELWLGESENGGIRFQVIATPGHTPGGCCYYCAEERVLLSGDTLFRQSYGRTDFPGGSTRQLMESLNQLMELPEEVRVLPGHGEATTIGEEKYLL